MKVIRIITYLLLISSFLIQSFSQECTGKIAKQRPALFIHAEQCKEAFGKSLEDCKNSDNCSESDLFQNTVLNTIKTIYQLKKYQKNLEQNKQRTCKVCEKKEAEEKEEQLKSLLQNPEAQDFIAIIKENI